VTSYSEIPVAGEPIRVYAFEPRKGDAEPTIVAGRLPARPDEVALGPRLAARLDLVPGDDITLNRPDGRPVHRRVVGIAVVRHIGTEFRQGNDIVVPPGALPELAPMVFGRQADIRATPGQAAALAADVGNRLEIATAELPPEVTTLAEIRLLPYTVALVAGAGGLAGLLHALYSTRQRNRREYAILRALGFTRRQLGTARIVTALALVVPALLVGVPVGLGTGRVAWYEIAVSAGVGGDALIPTGWVLAVAAAVLLVACLAAAAARPGSAEQPGRTLRVE
jgi:ABC-type lipoprotein release transport system permease subunit